MTDPAATHASSPISTGATNTLSTPVLTLRPIVVRPFGRPDWCGKLAVIAPAPIFVPSPMSASPMYERCGTLARSPIREFLISTNVPAFERSEEHTSELQSHVNLVCRLLLEKKNK